jgi:hypothetical protein
MPHPRTIVTFKTDAFNTSTPLSHFLNPQSFGDDVCRAILERLRSQGVDAQGLDQEDFGWFFCFSVNGAEHDFVIGYRPSANGEQGTWIGEVERRSSLWSTLQGRRRRDVDATAVALIDDAIHRLPSVSNVLWHDAGMFRNGNEDRGSASPSTP